MLSSAATLTLASRAFMRRTLPIPRLLPNMNRITLTPATHSRTLFFSSTSATRQAIAASSSLPTADNQDRIQEPIDRSLIAPWFHELDDMPEERMCIVAPSTLPPAFPAMPPKPAPASMTPSGKRWIHSSSTAPSSPPDPPATPYASDDPTQPPGYDRNKQIRAQAAWQEMQQAGIACPVAPPAAESADTAAQPVADASNPTNAYGKLHPADTHGRGHIGLGEHELEVEHDVAARAPLAGNWDDSDLAGKDTQIRVPDTEPEANADDQVLPHKPEDFVGACVAWHPVASMLFGQSVAARVHYGGGVPSAARGYATSAKLKVDDVAGKIPKVAEIVNPGGQGGGKPRIRQSMQEKVRVKSAVNEVKARSGRAYTDVEGRQEQQLSDEGDEYQDGAIRNPHKEFSGN